MVSITINSKKLSEAIAKYKASFDDNWERERYKWEFLASFEKNWDIEAEDFGTMFASATAENPNLQLLSSVNNYPRKMMLDFIKADQERVREMFRNLFDESKEVFDRVKQFNHDSEDMRSAYNPGTWKNHYQSFNTITTYLWLRFPGKYYIYRYSECRSAFAYLGSSFIPKKNFRKETIPSSFEVFEIMRKALKADPECRTLLDSSLTDGMYPDPELCTMAIDFNFFVSRYLCPQKENNPGVRYWIYSPGEKAEGWDEFYEKGIMGLGWKELEDYDQYNSLEEVKEKLRSIYGPGEYMNDGLAVWQFANDVKPGDIIYAKKGRSTVIGRGKVISGYIYDDSRAKFKSIRKVEWDFKGNVEYPGVSAMKTITDITNCHEKLDAAIDGPKPVKDEMEFNKDVNYIWMNANPSYWDIDEYPEEDEQFYSQYNEDGKKRRMPIVFTEAKLGDYLFAYETNKAKAIKAIYKVTKPLHNDSNDGWGISMKLVKKVTPIKLETLRMVPELESIPPVKNMQGSLFFLKEEEAKALLGLIAGTYNALVPYSYSDDPDKPFLSEEEFNSIVRLLSRKKNIILQGSPGVGKTFIAKKIAYANMGVIDDSRIQLIQFNQNYSYEDFIQGYKPNGDGFKLKDGVFFEFCERAKEDSDHDYFFIIDEINRGNLSKIFGELLMLLEKPYRGPGHAMKLAYSNDGDTFFVPENVYVIGMMNSADRSLAMIDYALRRRFSFVDMEPCFSTEAFKAYAESLESDTFNNVISVMKKLNQAISEDDSLGKGFRIGHSYFCGADADSCTDEWVADIVKYDIIPLLEEYWFDNRSSLDEWAKELKKAAGL